MLKKSLHTKTSGSHFIKYVQPLSDLHKGCIQRKFTKVKFYWSLNFHKFSSIQLNFISHAGKITQACFKMAYGVMLYKYFYHPNRVLHLFPTGSKMCFHNFIKFALTGENLCKLNLYKSSILQARELLKQWIWSKISEESNLHCLIALWSLFQDLLRLIKNIQDRIFSAPYQRSRWQVDSVMSEDDVAQACFTLFLTVKRMCWRRNIFALICCRFGNRDTEM